MKHPILTVMPVMIAAVFVSGAFRGAVHAAELDVGMALRQNALLMRWPSGMRESARGERGFGMSETRARFFASASAGGGIFNAAIESRAGFSSSSLAKAGLLRSEGSLLGQGKPLRKWDLSFDHMDDSATSLSSSIDRFDVLFHVGDFDIDAGRQPLSMGTSHFVGVLDVIAPFAPGDLDATYKPGVDAVRIRKGVGMTGEAEIIAVAADDISDGAILGRTRLSWGSYDIEFVGGRFRRRGYGGLGWEGGTAPWGFWGEAAVFERLRGRETKRGGWSEAAFSAVAGLDYYVEADFVVGGGLMFQDFGVRDPKDIVTVYSDAPYREGWVFLGSAGYGVLTVSKKLHPLVQADGAGLVNLIDGSTLWQPRITVSTGDNTDISFYGWIGTGDGVDTRNGAPVMRSEFGGMPEGGGFYGRWFF